MNLPRQRRGPLVLVESPLSDPKSKTALRSGLSKELVAGLVGLILIGLFTQFGVQAQAESLEAFRDSLSDDDLVLLDEIQEGCFRYFWNEVGDPVPLVRDRKLGPVSSIAAIGFQLASLPIGVERHWISREEAEQRSIQILTGLMNRHDNQFKGIYLHFPDLNSAGLSEEGYEIVASTVDHALLVAGAIPAAVYFGGETNRLVERLIDESNWQAYSVGPQGFLSMGWKPKTENISSGQGEFLPYHWKDAGDEERLIYFLGVGSPNQEHRLAPRLYYQPQRTFKQWEQSEPFVVTYPGALFTYFFSHCYIDYRLFKPDRPNRFGSNQPSVDWYKNSRTAILTHRKRCIELAPTYSTFSENRWGASACDGPTGYIVPHVRPNLANKDEWHQGTVAPYAAGSSIMFTPQESLAALRAFRELQTNDGKPLLWHSPKEGGYGFTDAFNLDLNWVSQDTIGIDQGPLLLAIENARSGLIWKLFMQHPTAQAAVTRLGWELLVSEKDHP